jgi:hypothetical protein
MGQLWAKEVRTQSKTEQRLLQRVPTSHTTKNTSPTKQQGINIYRLALKAVQSSPHPRLLSWAVVLGMQNTKQKQNHAKKHGTRKGKQEKENAGTRA